MKYGWDINDQAVQVKHIKQMVKMYHVHVSKEITILLAFERI